MTYHVDPEQLGIRPHDVVLALPRRWVSHPGPDDGVVLAARARVVPASGFAPELVLRSTVVEAGTAGDGGLAAWAAASLVDLHAQLDAVDVEDEESYELDGRPVLYRRFAHRLGATDVVCDQWSWVADGVGVTLTGSVARDDYADYCDVFEAVAATVEIRSGTAAA